MSTKTATTQFWLNIDLCLFQRSINLLMINNFVELVVKIAAQIDKTKLRTVLIASVMRDFYCLFLQYYQNLLVC